MLLGVGRPCRQPLVHERREVDADGRRRRAASARASASRPSTSRDEPLDLRERALESRRPARRTSRSRFSSRRRSAASGDAQLVGGVGDELVLRAQELLELRRRRVEGAWRPRAPRAAPAGRRARGEVAFAGAPRRQPSAASGAMIERAKAQADASAASEHDRRDRDAG